jgi:hypothetical protein
MKAVSLHVSAAKFLMLAAIIFFGSVASFAQAQASTADLRGIVTDPSGAVVPGATVTARSGATGITEV